MLNHAASLYRLGLLIAQFGKPLAHLGKGPFQAQEKSPDTELSFRLLVCRRHFESNSSEPLIAQFTDDQFGSLVIIDHAS